MDERSGLDEIAAFAQSAHTEAVSRRGYDARSAVLLLLDVERLVLANLFSTQAVASLGLDLCVPTSDDYTDTQSLSALIHDHRQKPDGITYRSRFDPEQSAVVLFGRARKKVRRYPSTRIQRLKEGGERLGVELASGHTETSRPVLGRLKKSIRDRNGDFHRRSMTGVILPSTTGAASLRTTSAYPPTGSVGRVHSVISAHERLHRFDHRRWWLWRCAARAAAHWHSLPRINASLAL